MACAVACVAAAEAPGPSDRPLTYPETRTVDVVEAHHGIKVADPYRWMEDVDAPDVKAWIAAQNRLTFRYLAEIHARGPIKRRLTDLWNYPRYNTPTKRGGRYFFSKNDGLQNQSVLYVADSLDGQPRVLLDPNKLSEDGTIALSGSAVSEDGKRLAYGLSSAGSDWIEYKVRNVDTGKDLVDHLKWIKFSGASWTRDGKGFFYSRYDKPAGDQLQDVNYHHKLYYHRQGNRI